MKHNGSSLKSIFEKTAFFSNEIDRLNRRTQYVHKKKDMLAKKVDNPEKDLLSTAETLHRFLYETIFKIADLYSEIQQELEKKE
ncbi:MAG: hypothetical protein PVI26_05460 [Chitinispirillia bacterium]